MKTIEIDIDVNRTIENGRINFEESHNDILRRLLGIDTRRLESAPQPRPRSPRSSGAYSTAVGSAIIEANSLKELLKRAVLVCEKAQPGFLEKLARIPTPKGRYIVSRTASGLYPKSPQLVEYADKMNGEWWYDTNVGRNQVQAYFRMISKLARLPHVPQINKRSAKTTLTLKDLDLELV